MFNASCVVYTTLFPVALDLDSGGISMGAETFVTGAVGGRLVSTGINRAWLGFLRQGRSLVRAVLRRTIRLKGPPRLLFASGKCFPS